jgi:hypothetical protein
MLTLKSLRPSLPRKAGAASMDAETSQVLWQIKTCRSRKIATAVAGAPHIKDPAMGGGKHS